MMVSDDTLIISTNFWRIPNPETALDGIVEGCPSPEEQRLMRQAAADARVSWQPSEQALNQLVQMKQFVGSRVTVQFWDKIMMWFEEEGPYPIDADCIDVVVMRQGQHQQAYLVLASPVEHPNEDGYSPLCYLEQRQDSNYSYAPIADIYSVSKL